MTDKNETPTSRRTVLRAGLGLVGVGLAMGAAQEAMAQTAQKIPQSQVQYQNHPNPAHPGQLCSVCVNYLAPNNCKLVQGPIAPIGWCIAFAPKAG